MRCPTHNLPMLTEYTSRKQFCKDCRLDIRKARGGNDWQRTDAGTKHAERPGGPKPQQGSEYHKKYYRDVRGPKKMAERAARKQEATG